MQRSAQSALGRAAALLAVSLVLHGPLLPAQQVAAEPRIARGVVRDENGAPLSGAAIGLLASGADLDVAALLLAPITVSDGDGRYEIDASAAGAWSSVIVAARDRQTCMISLDASEKSGEQVLQDAILVPGVQLIGRVRGSDGAALAGVRVTVGDGLRTAVFGSLRVRSGASSDARGIFVVPGVPRLGLIVTMRCAGYVGCTMLAAQGSPLDVTLQPAAVVRGRVLDAEGAPVAEAPVSFVMGAASPPMMPARTDAEGRFAIDVPPGTLVRLKATSNARSYASDLLRGAHNDVVLTAVEGRKVLGRTVKLLVRDAASGVTLPQVHVSQLTFGANQPVIALFHRRDVGAEFAGEAAVPLQQNTRALLVEAPGHGFELIDVADGDGDGEPQVVALGPEALVTGVVTDAETGKPLAGAYVRALPKGNSSGSGGTLEGMAPISDAQGRYRIEGLRSGEYTVQVHVVDRVASAPEEVDLREQREAALDLVAPARVWLDIVVEGELSTGPAPVLCGDALGSDGGRNGFFQHRITPTPPLSVRAAGKVRFGPVQGRIGQLMVYVPSRLRCDAGSWFGVEVGGGEPILNFAKLRSVVFRGRVEAADLPTARVAVVAERVGEGSGGIASRAGLEAGGQFALDLLPGRYRLSLVDLESNLEFYSEAAEIEVSASMPELVLRPELHWLNVGLQADQTDGELMLQSMNVTASTSGGANRFNGSSTASSTLVLVPGRHTVRLLLPPGTATLTCSRSLARLGRDAKTYGYDQVVEQQVTIERPETELTLRVPAPPSDDELRKEHG